MHGTPLFLKCFRGFTPIFDHALPPQCNRKLRRNVDTASFAWFNECMESKKATPASNGKQVWLSTPVPNLVRLKQSGSYYLRGRFGGEPIRESLGTKSFRAAKVKLAERMSELRKAVPSRGLPKTIHEALTQQLLGIEKNQSLKESSKEHYREIVGTITKGDAAIRDVPLSSMDHELIRDWWSETAKRYAPVSANQAFNFIRRIVELGRSAGVIRGNPMAGLKRMRVPKTKLKILTAEEFRTLVAGVRAHPLAGDISANWISFAAFSGMRPGEIEALTWGDVGPDVITVRGGLGGTKNNLERPVPIIPPMRDLLATMKRGKPTDLVFTRGRPKKSLASACRRLGLPHLRIYDLRHTFATFSIAAGVDVPTLAKWLGHQDGGKLAMATYIHPTDEHSQRSAAKVTFK